MVRENIMNSDENHVDNLKNSNGTDLSPDQTEKLIEIIDKEQQIANPPEGGQNGK